MPSQNLLFLGATGAGKTLFIGQTKGARRIILVEEYSFSLHTVSLNWNGCTHDVAICRGSTERIATKTVSTVGTNMQKLAYKKTSLDIRELGGSMAPVWNNFFKDCTTILVRLRLWPCYFAPFAFLMRNTWFHILLARLHTTYSLCYIVSNW